MTATIRAMIEATATARRNAKPVGEFEVEIIGVLDSLFFDKYFDVGDPKGFDHVVTGRGEDPGDAIVDDLLHLLDSEGWECGKAFADRIAAQMGCAFGPDFIDWPDGPSVDDDSEAVALNAKGQDTACHVTLRWNDA